NNVAFSQRPSRGKIGNVARKHFYVRSHSDVSCQSLNDLYFRNTAIDQTRSVEACDIGGLERLPLEQRQCSDAEANQLFGHSGPCSSSSNNSDIEAFDNALEILAERTNLTVVNRRNRGQVTV